MSSAEAVQELLDSPELPKAVEHLSAVLESERQHRERFYEEITPSMKAEFINGEIIVHSPVSLNHLNATRNLVRMLDSFVSHHDLGDVFTEKALIALTRNDYEPDICFFSKAKASLFDPEQTKFPAPDLIVEILSSSTEARDRGIKFRDYAANGVGEYWLVNTAAQELEQYRLENKLFQLALKSNSGELQSLVIAGCIFPIRAIFDSKLALETVRQFLS